MAKFSIKLFAKILYGLANEPVNGDIDGVAKSFINFLRRKRMFKKTDQILKEYKNYSEEMNGVKKIEITSSRKLEKEIVSKINRHFGEKTQANENVDESLIGGVVIKDRFTILDGSVKAQIARLRRNLTN